MQHNKDIIVVGVSDAKISNTPSDIIASSSLSSCIAVCVYDKDVKAGGMLHYQLPDSSLDPEIAKNHPFMFADTGLELLLQSLYPMGCKKESMRVVIAGGAEMRYGPANFEIGQRNYLAICKRIEMEGLSIDAEDIGGSSSRSLFLDLEMGTITMRIDGQIKELR